MHVNNHVAQAALSMAVGIAVVEAFVVRNARVAVIAKTKLLMFALVAYLGMLEIGQSFFGRHADLSDWLVNALAAVAAMVLFGFYRRRSAPARPVEGIRREGPVTATHRRQSRT
jgi:VanZ family protein